LAARRRTKKPDGEAALIVQPYGRTQTTWTPALIKQAESQAQSGDLRMAAQLCEWLLGDEQIARLLHGRAQALLGLEPTFEASGDKRKSSRVVRALEGQEDWWDGWPEPQLAEMLVWGILLGVSVARHGWEVLEGHGGRILPLPKVWEAQHVRYDLQKRTWIAKVTSEGSGFAAGIDEEFEPGDGTWLLHAPYGAARPWMRGLWRGLARFRLLRDYAVSDFGRAGEGAARNVVEAPDKDTKQTKELRQELATDLSTMGRDGTIVLPSGLTYKLVETSASTADMYVKQLEVSERAFQIAIRGGNLTTNVEGGSKAAAEVQERLGDDANLRFDAQSLTTTIHDQSMVWWAEFNFGSAALAPWPVYPVEQEADLKHTVETEDKAFEVVKKAEDLGFDVDRKAFLEDHKITWAKPGTKPAAPPPPPPPGAAPQPAPAPGKPPTKADPQATGRGSLAHLLMLASGARAEANRGFLDGQSYAETAHDWAAKRGVDVLATDLEQLSAVILSAESPDDLRAKLEQFLGDDFDPDELAELTARAMILCELAGQLAVRKDVPELEN
jgi:hypothetical protein